MSICPSLKRLALPIILACLIFPFLATAQEPPAKPCGHIPPTIETGGPGDCAITAVYDKANGEPTIAIEFASLNGDNCTPTLESAQVDEINRAVTINLVNNVPPSFGCLTIISPFTIQTQPLPLTKGDWDVVVVQTSESETLTYTGRVTAFSYTLFLPLVITP